MLTSSEIIQFYRIWCALIWGINEAHGIVPKFDLPVYGNGSMDRAVFAAIRNKLWDNPEWIDEFIRQNEYGDLTQQDLGILIDWRKNFIKDQFVIIKYLNKSAVFMPLAQDDPNFYSVCGISDPVREVVPFSLPLMVDAVLLPFGGRIIYDSLLAPLNATFSRSAKESFMRDFNATARGVGIIERMDAPPTPAPGLAASDTKGANVPKSMAARYAEVAEIIENFCNEKLTDEFAAICLYALAKLCRKRPSPLQSGKARTWACGIVYAIGQNNFIFDKSGPIYMAAADIASWFGLAKSTAGNKAAQIAKLLDIHRFNPDFLLDDLAAKYLRFLQF